MSLFTEPVVHTVLDFDPPKYIVMHADGVAGRLHDTRESAEVEAETARVINARLAKMFAVLS